MNALDVYEKLYNVYGKPNISLEYEDPLQLLIATILSAQCTDERVNKVTPGLFERFKTAEDFSEADLEDIKRIIRSTGFYNAKAKNIQNACRMIVEDYDGKVPHSMEDLIRLPGVARKTANIVLSHAFGKNEGIAVDTHMTRINYRLGLTQNKDPVKIEKDLMMQLPREIWSIYSHIIIEHGRAVCKAPTPVCSKCILEAACPKRGVGKRV